MIRHPLYRSFFGFQREPFGIELNPEEVFATAALQHFTERFDYVIGLGAIGLLTGEVGAGKSTALRFAASRLHPSQYLPLWIIASSGSILETYRQLAAALGTESRSSSRAVLTRVIRQAIGELVNKKIQPLLIIDEASLLRLDVFAELHTLSQFDADSKPHLPVILAGQSNLVDSLQYRSSLPLASRIVAKSHLEGIDLEQMKLYLAVNTNAGTIIRPGSCSFTAIRLIRKKLSVYCASQHRRTLALTGRPSDASPVRVQRVVRGHDHLCVSARAGSAWRLRRCGAASPKPTRAVGWRAARSRTGSGRGRRSLGGRATGTRRLDPAGPARSRA